MIHVRHQGPERIVKAPGPSLCPAGPITAEPGTDYTWRSLHFPYLAMCVGVHYMCIPIIFFKWMEYNFVNNFCCWTFRLFLIQHPKTKLSGNYKFKWELIWICNILRVDIFIYVYYPPGFQCLWITYLFCPFLSISLFSLFLWFIGTLYIWILFLLNIFCLSVTLLLQMFQNSYSSAPFFAWQTWDSTCQF